MCDDLRRIAADLVSLSDVLQDLLRTEDLTPSENRDLLTARRRVDDAIRALERHTGGEGGV